MAVDEVPVDTDPPVVRILAPLPGIITDPTLTLILGVSEFSFVFGWVDVSELGDPSFEIELDSGEEASYSINLPDGPHVFTVQATDLAGNVGRATVAFTVVTGPQVFEIEAQYFRRPTRHIDAEVNVDAPVRIRIPDHKAIGVLAGNPDRYVLFLQLGDVRCVYLRGHPSAFGSSLPSPFCGRYRAGDEVTVEKVIYARILFGDPRRNETSLRIFLDVLGPVGDDAGE